PGRMLALEANWASPCASHTIGKANGITQDVRRANWELTRTLGGLGWLDPWHTIARRCRSRSSASRRREASRQQRRTVWSACLAAGQEARPEGRNLSASAGLPPERGAGPLCE